MRVLKSFVRRRVKILYRFLTLMRDSGFLTIPLAARSSSFSKHFYRERKEYLSRSFLEKNVRELRRVAAEVPTGIEILNGPFEGLKYLVHQDSWFDHPQSIVQKVFGVYEQEVLNQLSNRRFELVIDIGAGTGYYSLGLLRSKICQFALMYESLESLHSAIKTSAALNGIADQQYSVRGTASPESLLEDLKLFLPQTHGAVVLICDVEGFECQLFSESIIQYLGKFNVTLFIEIHKGQFFKFAPHLDFLGVLEQYFEVCHLVTMQRNVSPLTDLAALTDDKWLLASEDRTNGSQVMVRRKHLHDVEPNVPVDRDS